MDKRKSNKRKTLNNNIIRISFHKNNNTKQSDKLKSDKIEPEVA